MTGVRIGDVQRATVPRHGQKHTAKLALKGQHIYFVMIVVMVIVALIPIFMQSSINGGAPPAGKGPSVGKGNRLPQSNWKQHLQQPEANLNNAKIQEQFPKWNKSARDGVDDLDSYATLALTGSYTFLGSSACEARGTDDSSACLIHFPWVDLKDHVGHDEALDVIPFNRFMRPRVAKTSSTTRQYPEPTFIPKLQLSPLADQYFALLTRCGCKGAASGVHANQDRAVLVSPFFHNNDASQNDFVMGIFDGHGELGHAVSHFSALELPRILSLRLKESGISSEASVKQTLTDTFLEIDRTLPDTAGAGSTGSVMLRLEHRLYVANVGDSQSFVASCDIHGDDVKILYRNRLHKPHLPEERARIEEAGGEVLMPQGPGDSSRVIVPLPGTDEFLALAMSRSIGDKEAKAEGVISDPTIDVLHLDEMISSNDNVHMFAVTASDGLFDHIPTADVAEHLAKSLFRNDTPRPLEACEQLIMKSSELWIEQGIPYRDDITVAVTKVVL